MNGSQVGNDEASSVRINKTCDDFRLIKVRNNGLFPIRLSYTGSNEKVLVAGEMVQIIANSYESFHIRAVKFDHLTPGTAYLCTYQTDSLEKNWFIRYTGPKGDILNPECEIDKF